MMSGAPWRLFRASVGLTIARSDCAGCGPSVTTRLRFACQDGTHLVAEPVQDRALGVGWQTAPQPLNLRQEA